MDLSALKAIFADNGCPKIYAKTLAPNDNSKNQVYLGGSFELLNIFPISSITTDSAGDWERERFKAMLPFSWINPDGQLSPAPRAQLILYPKYPEVRFSGFLLGCDNPPSQLMTQRLAGRILFFGVSVAGRLLGYVTSPDSALAREFNQLRPVGFSGVFYVIDLPAATDNRNRLLQALRAINQKGWIGSKRLNKDGDVLPCNSPNCGGYTLEAELGISPNGYSEPDFLGWEIKQFAVDSFNNTNGARITLMTPEPTGGFYTESGVPAFIHKYGYADKMGRPDRMNFGGVHKVGEVHSVTELTLTLDGYDMASGRIRNAGGMIALLDKHEHIAASWSFAQLLLHWNKKHNQACYVPSLKSPATPTSYCYGKDVLLCTGTSFDLFLQQMAEKNIVYDPGIKIENISSGSPKTKRRSQFRMVSRNLGTLYRTSEVVGL